MSFTIFDNIIFFFKYTLKIAFLFINTKNQGAFALPCTRGIATTYKTVSMMESRPFLKLTLEIYIKNPYFNFEYISLLKIKIDHNNYSYSYNIKKKGIQNFSKNDGVYLL